MQLEEVLGEVAVRSPRGKMPNRAPGSPAAAGHGGNSMNAEAAEKPEAPKSNAALSPRSTMVAQVSCSFAHQAQS